MYVRAWFVPTGRTKQVGARGRITCPASISYSPAKQSSYTGRDPYYPSSRASTQCRIPKHMETNAKDYAEADCCGLSSSRQVPKYISELKLLACIAKEYFVLTRSVTTLSMCSENGIPLISRRLRRLCMRWSKRLVPEIVRRKSA